MFTKNYLTAAHKTSWQNKGLLSKSRKCGCFSCIRIFEPSLIYDWSDQPKDEELLGEILATAWCPYCFIDSIIPEAAGFPIKKELLCSMNSNFFDGAISKSNFLNNSNSVNESYV